MNPLRLLWLKKGAYSLPGIQQEFLFHPQREGNSGLAELQQARTHLLTTKSLAARVVYTSR